MNCNKNLLFLSFLAIFVSLSGCSLFQTADPITTGVSGVVTNEVAGEIMEDVDQKVSKWMNNAAIQANNVASDLINQVDSMRVNILSDTDYLADKQIANLDAKLQHKINSLNNAVAQLEESFAQDATKISREASLGIREALWGLPFTGEDLAVSYIDGTYIPYKETGLHTISLQGHNVGFDSEKYTISANLEVTLDDNKTLTIKGAATSESERNFSFTHAELLGYRDEKANKAFDGVMDILVKKDIAFWPFDKKIALKIPVRIVLSPDYVGDIEGSVLSPVLGWASLDTPDFIHTTPSGHPNGNMQSSGKRYSVSPFHNPPRLGDKRITSAGRVDCKSIDAACNGWQSGEKCVVENSGSSVYCSISNWSHSLNLTYRAIVQQYKHIKDDEQAYGTVGITYSKPFEISVPKGFYSASYVGKTRNGDTFTISMSRNVGQTVVPAPVLSNSAPVRHLNTVETHNEIRYLFEAI